MSADQGGFEYGRGDEPVDDARFADLPPVQVRVPDDARELTPDVRAYYRELRRRHDEGHPAPSVPPDLATGVRPGRMIVGVLALLLVVASLALMVSPRREAPNARASVTSATLTGPGTGAPGLLLPDSVVFVESVERALRDLRPAVVVLVPPACACDAQLRTLSQEASSYELDLLLSPGAGAPPSASGTENGSSTSGTENGSDELRRIVRELGSSRVKVLLDPAGSLLAAFAPTELTLVLVAVDGLVAEVRHGPSTMTALDLALSRLSHPTAAPGETLAQAEPAQT